MSLNIQNPRVLDILSLKGESDNAWQTDLERLLNGDMNLNRHTAGENSIKAVQRVLIFLGYSTTTKGSFAVDGDYGRGTNRGVAQFQFEHGLNDALTRDMLCYPCTWHTASRKIVSIPEVTLDRPTLEKLAEVLEAKLAAGNFSAGNIDEALYHLDSVHRRDFYNVRQVKEKYGPLARTAAARLLEETGFQIHPRWILTIIKQETTGIIRPKFEQHWLSKYHKRNPAGDFAEDRFKSMSFGLGQIMGFNHQRVGAASAQALFTAPIEDQVYYLGKFLLKRTAKMRAVVIKDNPVDADFHTIGRYYNGPKYADHHYHESIHRWWREFTALDTPDH